MNANHEERTVDLDSSTSLEFDRRIVVQETVDSLQDVDVSRCRADRQHCGTDRREFLQQPFVRGEIQS